MIKINHPKQYSEILEEKILNECEWYMSDTSGVMINDKKSLRYKEFYNLFFPIFSESFLNNEVNYEYHCLYLINHSKDKNEFYLPKSKESKIIYFVNNSNAQVQIKDERFDLNKMGGKSIFVKDDDDICIIRATNIQTCIVSLHLATNNYCKKIYN